MFACKHSAGGKYVLSPGRTYRGRDALAVQPVTEGLHHRRGWTVIREIGDAVEADQVDPAFQSPKQHCKRVGVPLVVVEACKHSI